MSTYFETYVADTNKLQISDEYQGIGVGRTGTCAANLSAGQVYGLPLLDDEVYAMFRTENDTLAISPCVVYSGHRIYYVGTKNGSTIKYKTVSTSSMFKKLNHGEGMEIYDENSALVYSSNYEAISVGDFYNINPNVFIHYSDGDNITLYNNSWNPVAINDDGKGYIFSMGAPWGGEYTVWSYSNVDTQWHRKIYYGGYTFENGTIKTLQTPYISAQITTCLGGGDLNQIGNQYSYYAWSDKYGSYEEAGIWCANYSFNVLYPQSLQLQ